MIEQGNGIRIIEGDDQISESYKVFNHNMGIISKMIDELRIRMTAIEQQISDLARRERDWP